MDMSWPSSARIAGSIREVDCGALAKVTVSDRVYRRAGVERTAAYPEAAEALLEQICEFN